MSTGFATFLQFFSTRRQVAEKCPKAWVGAASYPGRGVPRVRANKCPPVIKGGVVGNAPGLLRSKGEFWQNFVLTPGSKSPIWMMERHGSPDRLLPELAS